MHSVLFYFWIHWISNTYSKPNRNYLQPPQSIARVGNVTNIELHVKPFTTTVLNKFNQPIANLTIRALEYNGTTQYIGPTIHAHPGDLINVTLINDLEGVGRMSEIDKYLNISVTERNYQSYKDPDVTNIHVHGLHVDPNIDDISLYVSPKCSKLINQTYWNQLDCYVNQSATPHVVNAQNYPYRIPYDHYPGTHWYHAHRHGSVTFDIMSGIYGLFIIDDIDYVPPMIDIELLISFTWLHGGDFCRHRISKDMKRKIGSPCIGTGKDNRPRTLAGDGYVTYPFNFPIQSACFINCRMQHEIKTSFTLDDGTHWTQLNASSIGIYPVDLNANIVKDDGGVDGKQYFIVNGQIQPYIHINASNWYHFRIVNTVMNYLLFWVANDTTAINCDFEVMGQDGIYFQNGSRNLFYSPYIDRKIILPPGSRADISIRCKCNIQESIDGICDYEIYASSKFEIKAIDKFVPLPLRDILLFTLEVPICNQSNHEIWKPQPYSSTPYLFDTLSTATNSFCASASGDYYKNMTQCNVVQGRERYPAGKPKFQSLEAINQFTFNSSNYLAKICSDDTHEWLITNNFHPIHQHTFPFQLQENITNGWMALIGDWRDTVGGTGTFRIKSNLFTKDFEQFTAGSLIMHCHYVPHEDHGMMAKFELIRNCSSIAGKYIIPIANESNVITQNAIPTIRHCIQRNATTIVYLKDVNCYINIQLMIYNNCYFEFIFTMKPRSQTIGNVWIGLGVNGNQTRFNLSNPIYANMTGDALIISILATDNNKPLSKLTAEEVHLDYHKRTTKVYNNNYFECNQFNSNNYILS
eukprot:422225_1